MKQPLQKRTPIPDHLAKTMACAETENKVVEIAKSSDEAWSVNE